MGSGLLPRAIEVATRVRDAQRVHAFEHVASDFVRLLGTVPDFAANEISKTEVVALHRIAEGVIEQIEVRLNSRPDRPVRQQALANTVYEISRLLEEVNTWRQHDHPRRAR